MDIGLVLSKIRPNAKYKCYDTYENLISSWEDDTLCPTLEELTTQWNAMQNPTKAQKLTALNNEYNPQILSLQTQISIDVVATKNLVAETAHRNSLTALQAEYNAKRTVILNG